MHAYSSSLPGLSNCTGKMVVIFFHVLIPKPFWEWDSESKVFLRFGCSELGKWNRDIGDFTRRYAGLLIIILYVCLFLYAYTLHILCV